MGDAARVVVVDVGELEAIVEAAVRRALDGRAAQPDEWLDSAAVAELLGVHPRSVTKRANAGELPGTRIGKLWRFRRADIEAFLARG